jgi:hypothetical protein
LKSIFRSYHLDVPHPITLLAPCSYPRPPSSSGFLALIDGGRGMHNKSKKEEPTKQRNLWLTQRILLPSSTAHAAHRALHQCMALHSPSAFEFRVTFCTAINLQVFMSSNMVLPFEVTAGNYIRARAPINLSSHLRIPSRLPISHLACARRTGQRNDWNTSFFARCPRRALPSEQSSSRYFGGISRCAMPIFISNLSGLGFLSKREYSRT